MIEERRRAPRYRLAAEITVDGAIGRTIDLSAISVYFETTRRFAPGAALTLVFPFEHAGPGSNVNCRGHVVRVDERGGGLYGVAATYEPVAFSVQA